MRLFGGLPAALLCGFAVVSCDTTSPEPALENLALVPGFATIVAGDTVWVSFLTTTPNYDYQPRPCPSMLTSSAPSIAEVAPGSCLDRVKVTTLVPGTVTLVGSLGGRVDTATITVVAPYAFAAIAAGPGHACGLTASGRAACWGSNHAHQLGFDVTDDGCETCSTAGPRVPVRGGTVFAGVAVGGFSSCGWTAAGAVSCWGQGYGAGPVSVPGAALASLSVGSSHSCGLDAAGVAWCWGANGDGQIGDGTTTARAAPVAIGGALRFSRIAVGSAHTCATSTAGAAWCWGRNDNGQLGTGDTVAARAPRAVTGGRVFAAIGVGNGHACGIDAAGSAWCWGRNQAGQLGAPVLNDPACAALDCALAPREVDLGFTQLTRITLGDNASCGLTAAGRGHCWGEMMAPSGPVDCPDGPDFCFGGGGAVVAIRAPLAVAGSRTYAAVYHGGALWRGTDGRIYSWTRMIDRGPYPVPATQ